MKEYDDSTEHLKKLRKLTKKLTFSELIHKENQHFRIDTEKGTMICFGLHKDKNVAIARAFASKDTVMSFHIHERCREWIGVAEGRIIVLKENQKIDVVAGDAIMIETEEAHSVHFPEDTWVWVVTMPADESFPE